MSLKYEGTIRVGGKLLDLSRPVVMGIVNVTPDSFYANSREQTELEIARRAVEIAEEGAPHAPALWHRQSKRRWHGCAQG